MNSQKMNKQESKHGYTTASRNTLRKLLRSLGKYEGVYLLSIVASTVGMALFGVIASYMLKDIMQLAQNKSTQGLLQLLIVNFALGVVSLLLWKTGTVHYNIEAKRGIAGIERKVFSKAMLLPMSYYENHHTGDFMSKLIFDTARAGDVYGSRFRRLVAPILAVIVYAVPMFLLSWRVTGMLMLVSMLMLVINTLFVRPMKKLGKELSKQNGTMTENLTNILSGIELCKIFNLGPVMVKKYRDSNEQYLNIQKKKNWLSAILDGINESLDLLSILTFLAIGVYFASIGMVSLSSLTAIYVMYGPFSWNFLQIGRYLPELTNCLANADRVFAFLEQEQEPERYKIPAAKGSAYIEFEDICFAYEEGRNVLDHFSLSIEKGKSVAITGKSGRGKSTLAKILLGFYEPQSGAISIAGKAYGSMTLDEIRDLIAYVPQEPYLYDVSIADNIAYGKPGATREEIIAAAKVANAHDFIEKLDQGYDTVAGERGNRLSGGEKQRIAIARAVLKDAPILLLDEATSALDNESEQLVSEAIDRMAKGRTTIMIAHRPATIARADRVVAM